MQRQGRRDNDESNRLREAIHVNPSTCLLWRQSVQLFSHERSYHLTGFRSYYRSRATCKVENIIFLHFFYKVTSNSCSIWPFSILETNPKLTAKARAESLSCEDEKTGAASEVQFQVRGVRQDKVCFPGGLSAELSHWRLLSPDACDVSSTALWARERYCQLRSRADRQYSSS